MEEVLVRFHQIGKQIFEELDNQSLTKCREVNESWRGFIDGEKTISFRMIKSLTNVPDAYLYNIFGKVDLDSVIELLKNVQQVYDEFRIEQQDYEIKGLNLLDREFIIVDIVDGTEIDAFCLPRELDENVLAKINAGELFLTTKGVSKPHPINPSNVLDLTPLHIAAGYGYFNVCKLIAENVQEKNPQDSYGETPLQIAEENGHSSVIEYFQSLLDVVDEPRKSCPYCNVVGILCDKIEDRLSKHIEKYHSEKKKSEMNPKEKKITPRNYEVLDEKINSAKSKRRKLV